MNFISSITLQFNDLFSSGFAKAQTSLGGLQGSLDGINPGGLGGLQTNLEGIDAALSGMNPSGLDRLRAGLAGLAGKGSEVKAAFADFKLDFKTDLLERGKQGIDQINAGMEKLAQNSSFTIMADTCLLWLTPLESLRGS